MTVGELRKLLRRADILDSTPLVMPDLLRARVELAYIRRKPYLFVTDVDEHGETLGEES